MSVLTKGHRVAPAMFKVLDEAQGIVEQWVSVFGVKDFGNDRVIPGAFADTLAEWQSSGDPIPVVFSHQWDNPEAFIGQVVEAEEMLPGDERLPEKIREFGGLYAKYQLDMEEPSARKLLKLLKRRIIRQASFSYDIAERQTGKDGANELLKLRLHEVGPCLLGMNELTDTGQVKSGAAKAPEPEKKAWVYVPGSYEERQAAVYKGVCEWVGQVMGYGYWPDLEATYPDRVIFVLWDWSDDSQRYFEATYEVAQDGSVGLGEPAEVMIQAQVIAKFRARKEGRRNSDNDLGRIQSAHDLFVELGAECAAAIAEDPAEGKAEEPRGRKLLFDAALAALSA